MAVVLTCVAEVNKAAFTKRPIGCHAFASLIRTEGLCGDDVDKPAGIEGFERTDDKDLYNVTESARM